MPEPLDLEKYIRRRGDKWVVTSEAGKVLGTHDSKESAARQLRAIESNKELSETDGAGLDDQRTIEGWISTEVIDKQNDLVPVDELEKAFIKYLNRGGPIMDRHSGKHVGKFTEYKKATNPSSGKPGIWAKGAIFRDYTVDDEVWRKVKSGEYGGFSIGGRSLKNNLVCKDGVCFNQTGQIEQWEVSTVPRPANQFALITGYNVLAKEDGSQEPEIEIYINPVETKKEEVIHMTPITEIHKDGSITVKHGCGCGGNGGTAPLEPPTGDIVKMALEGGAGGHYGEGISGDPGASPGLKGVAYERLESYIKRGSYVGGKASLPVGGTLGAAGMSGDAGETGLHLIAKEVHDTVEILKAYKESYGSHEEPDEDDEDDEDMPAKKGKGGKPDKGMKKPMAGKEKATGYTGRVDMAGRVPQSYLEKLLESVIEKLDSVDAAMEALKEMPPPAPAGMPGGPEGLETPPPAGKKEAAGAPGVGEEKPFEKPEPGKEKAGKPAGEKPEGKKPDAFKKEDNQVNATAPKEVVKMAEETPAAPPAAPAASAPVTLTKEDLSTITKGIVEASLREIMANIKPTLTPAPAPISAPSVPSSPKALTKEEAVKRSDELFALAEKTSWRQLGENLNELLPHYRLPRPTAVAPKQ